MNTVNLNWVTMARSPSWSYITAAQLHWLKRISVQQSPYASWNHCSSKPHSPQLVSRPCGYQWAFEQEAPASVKAFTYLGQVQAMEIEIDIRQPSTSIGWHRDHDVTSYPSTELLILDNITDLMPVIMWIHYNRVWVLRVRELIHFWRSNLRNHILSTI